MPRGETAAPGVGLLTLPARHSTGDGALDETYRDTLTSAIERLEAVGTCGWIVDLRSNSGGNMWPMLLGVEPLLRIPGDGIQVLGMLRGAGPNVPWESHDGTLMVKGRPMLGFGQAGYRLREPGAPVAVLLGERTASSGEATALAFRGRPDSRSFGAPTAGFATSNSSIRLPDGTLFLLTDTLMADRNGVGDGGPIVPDQITDGDAATLAAAQRWLVSPLGGVAQAKAAPRAG